MKIFKNKKEKGFSLVEVLVAISLNLFVVAMIIAVATSSLRHIRTIKDQRNLYSAVSSLNNQFNYWIKQGTNFEVLPANPGNRLEILIGSSTTTIATTSYGSYYPIAIDDGIDTDYLTGNNIKVGNLIFREMDHSVRIEFTLMAEGTNTPFSATTTIAKRN